jgi:hypothetical protein
VEAFPLYILVIVSLFDNGHSKWGEVIFTMVLTCTYWWLVMLSILSCACCPFVYFLWRNVYLDLFLSFIFKELRTEPRGTYA